MLESWKMRHLLLSDMFSREGKKGRCQRYCKNNNKDKKDEVGRNEQREDENLVDECEVLETWAHASQILDKGVGYFLPDPHHFANKISGGSGCGGEDDARMMTTASFWQGLVAEGRWMCYVSPRQVRYTCTFKDDTVY